MEVTLEKGSVVICAGGGGIPTIYDEGRKLHGIEAVIDKDSCSALLAQELASDLLVIATNVDAAYIDWGRRITGEFLGQQCRAQVLVDDRFDTVQLAALIVDGRYAATARTDHHAPFLEQPLHGTDLEDALGARARDHAAESVPIGGDAQPFSLARRWASTCE